jgi:type IV pilus assembly protein PilM
MGNIILQLKREYKIILAGFGIGPKPTDFIGLDIGYRYFRAVRVKKIGNEFSVKDATVGLVSQLKDLSKDMHITEDEEVAVNFTGDGLVIKRLNVPVMPYEEIGKALRWELKDQVSFDIDEAVIKFIILGENEYQDGAKRIELITLVYRESDIEKRTQELKDIGLNIQNMMPLDFALSAYAVYSRLIPEQEKIAIVDIGSIRTIISVIEKGKLYFTREIGVGGDSITDAMTGVFITDKGRIEVSKDEAERMKEEHGIPEDIKLLSMVRPVLEKLANQIRSSLEYYESQFRSERIKGLILAGNGSRLKGLPEYLSKEIRVEILDVLPENACAIGLALSVDTDFNMLPEKFRREKKRLVQGLSLRMASIVFGFIFLLSYSLLSVKAMNLKKEAGVYRLNWEELKDLNSLKTTKHALRTAIAAISYREINTGMAMKEFSNLVLPGLKLDSLIIKGNEPNVRIAGVIKNGNRLSEFMSILEGSDLFENVKLGFSKKNEGYGLEALDFEITFDIIR